MSLLIMLMANAFWLGIAWLTSKLVKLTFLESVALCALSLGNIAWIREMGIPL